MQTDTESDTRTTPARRRPTGRLRVLFAAGRLRAPGAGVTQSVTSTINALVDAGVQASLCTALPAGDAPPQQLTSHPGRCFAARGRWWGGLMPSRRLKSWIYENIRDFDVVHNHSVWMLPNHYASEAAWRAGRPVVISPRGTLEPWALRHASWKKQLVGLWFQNRDLRRASCLHALCEEEVDSFRRYGLQNPVAVIPNGIDLAQWDRPADPGWLDEHIPAVRGKRVCLFLGRLHRKKGVCNLIRAWGQVASRYNQWHLIIAGPDDGEGPAAQSLVRSLELTKSVTLPGPFYGDSKRSAHARAELFVLPSHSEGFPNAVLEAMASDTAVLITPGCHFRAAIDHGAGIEMSPDVAGVAAGLAEMLGFADQTRADMGARGRLLVESGYTWTVVAERLLQLYRWVLGDAPQPDFVSS